MSSSMIVCIFLPLFMVESQSIFGDITQGMVAFVQYSECSAFQTPPLSQGGYQVRTKTGCARICSEDTACVAYSVSGALCRTHDEMFQTGECYSGGLRHFNIRKRCTNEESTDRDPFRCKCYGGYIGDDCERLMIDCSEGFDSGHYDGNHGLFHIHPALSPEPFQVWCRMAYGGNTFIQRHEHNSTNFYRAWQDYKDGFGDLRYDFWLGNDKLSYLVNGRDYILYFNHRDVSTSSIRQQMYTKFKLNRTNGYQMSYEATWGDSSHDGGDCLGELRGQQFSTFDQDNDDSPLNCAEVHNSGFWFKNCTPCNPNGVWSETPDKKRAGVPEEMFWTSAHQDNLMQSCWFFVVTIVL